MVLLNDDVEVISRADGSSSWSRRSTSRTSGLTGAKLYFSDDTVQHAGHAYARRPLPAPLPSTCRATSTSFCMSVASVFPRLEAKLPSVQKPIQYVGGELNSIVKDWDCAPERRRRSAGR